MERGKGCAVAIAAKEVPKTTHNNRKQSHKKQKVVASLANKENDRCGGISGRVDRRFAREKQRK
jgi:hypothetical protein